MVVDPPVVAIPGRSPDGWKPGEFQILFLSMGQGDCCVITCPDGRHVMIDCGSAVSLTRSVQATVTDTRRHGSLTLSNTCQERVNVVLKLKSSLLAICSPEPLLPIESQAFLPGSASS